MNHRLEIQTGNTENTSFFQNRIEISDQKWIKIWIENKHGMWIKILDQKLDQILDQNSDQNFTSPSVSGAIFDTRYRGDQHDE